MADKISHVGGIMNIRGEKRYTVNDPIYHNMIENTSWKTGKISNRYTVEYNYIYEGKSEVKGKVELMSASDYGYASGGCNSSETLENYYSSTCKSTIGWETQLQV